MGRSIEEIQADIARVKAEMALRNKYEQGFNQPQTRTGWSSYIVNGDRGLLDAYQNRENQWKNQMQQQDFQAKEADYNRKLQEKIAGMNKAAADVDKMDENMLNRNKAVVRYNYAKSALEAAKRSGIIDDEEKATMDLALAKHELEYWNKRVNYKSPDISKKEQPASTPAQEPVPEGETPQSTETPTPAEPAPTNSQEATKVAIRRYNNINTIETEAEKKALLKEIKENPNWGQDSDLRDAYDHIDSIISKEQQKLNKAARKKKWEEGMKLSGFDFRKWKDSKEGKKLIEEFGE